MGGSAPDVTGGAAPGAGSGGSPGGGTPSVLGGSGGSATGGAVTSGTGGTTSSSGGAKAGGGTPDASGGMMGEGGGGAASGTGGSVASGGDEATGGTGGTGASTGGTSGAGADAGQGGEGGMGAAGGPPIVDIFNGTDLTGWTAYRETGETSPGTKLNTTQAEEIFKPEDGTIRVYGDAPDQSTQSRHTLVTDESYSKYNFWVEYQWGTKKFAPYTDLQQYPRDAGVLWHMHGDLTQVWPSSIELQIKDGTTGDIFALYARCTSLARNGGTTFVDAADGGTMKVVNGANGYVQHGRSENFEVDGWNSLELQVDGGTAIYIVNGHIVNRVLAVNDRSGSTGNPVTSGPIALQAEHAEVFYRNVRIQVLP